MGMLPHEAESMGRWHNSEIKRQIRESLAMVGLPDRDLDRTRDLLRYVCKMCEMGKCWADIISNNPVVRDFVEEEYRLDRECAKRNADDQELRKAAMRKLTREERAVLGLLES